MEKKYILALDQGTTSSRAILFNHNREVVAQAQKPFAQIFPHNGWVEHDAGEIWSTQSSVAAEVIAKADLTGLDIACIGITNQRETTIVWDRKTSQPLYNAIVWQDRRTAGYCDQLIAEGHQQQVQAKTGLVIDAYFSATKIKWILDHVAGARQRAQQGELCFGTVDSWLVWKLTRGRHHITDVTNAARTLLFNIHTLQWDDELLELFDIPRSMLPDVRSCSEIYCQTATTLFSTKIPISGIIGDQQSALFGHLCTKTGMTKTTYGTGCFMVMNTGDKVVQSKHHLLSTIAWKIGDRVSYALEGSVFMGGATLQWLKDSLGILSSWEQGDKMADSLADNADVYFVPAFTGLAAPYWNQYARGTIVGLSRATTAAHIVRAAMEGIAYQVYDVLEAMRQDSGMKIPQLMVDGGAIRNNFLMQFQCDICRTDLVRPSIHEITALGAAYMAGLAVGYWPNIESLQHDTPPDKVFRVMMEPEKATHLIDRWHKAVARSIDWEIDTE